MADADKIFWCGPGRSCGRRTARRGHAAPISGPARSPCAILNWDLLELLGRPAAGSHATQRDREYALVQVANALHELGYRGLRANGLKGKHIEALVRDWSGGRLSEATMMKRMAHVSLVGGISGKRNMVEANAEYGIGPRSHASDGARCRDLDEGKHALVKDAHVRRALCLHAGLVTRDRVVGTAHSRGGTWRA